MSTHPATRPPLPDHHRCPYLIGRLRCTLRRGHPHGHVAVHGSHVPDKHGTAS